MLLIILVEYQSTMIDREDVEGYHQEGDEMINEKDEEKVYTATPGTLPKKLKASIKFAYDEGMKNYLETKGESFEEYVEAVFTQTQVYWRHPSLTTELIFEVIDRKNYNSIVYQNNDLEHYEI